MTAAPNVSVVIPVHNGERHLAEAIESVLAQSAPPLECIVVDDGSTDGTAAVARAFGAAVRCVQRTRGGVSAARNHGTALATGEFVAFLDHDDVWEPAKLERQLQRAPTPDRPLTLCAVRCVDVDGRPLRELRLDPHTDLVTGMLLFDGTETVPCGSAGLFLRAGLHAIGGFDESLSTSADWDLLLRIALGGAPGYVDELLVRYRVHAGGMSRRVALTESDMRRAFTKAFADPRLPAALRDRQRHAHARLYRMLSGSYRDAGEPLAAARTLTRALVYDPRLAGELVRRPPRLWPSRPPAR
jgi:glycosyltransferase involved in cell wall biosynthesis